MPERSRSGPSDPSENPSFLEPSGNAYELAVTTDADVARRVRELQLEDDVDAFIKKKLGVAFWVACGWFAFIALAAVAASFLQNRGILLDPFKLDRKLLAPGQTGRVGAYTPDTASIHLLGTDSLGRDVLSRIIYGGRVSLQVGFASIALGLLIGVTIGLVAGYLRGWVDSVLMSMMDIMLAFPAILLALAIIGFSDRKDIVNISLALGIVAVPAIARLVRASTLTYREREFVLASRTLGASHLRILVREILPNVLPPVMSLAVIGVAVAISAEAALAFVGVSVPLPTATWGGMINDGKDQLLLGNPQLVLIPCTVLVLTVMSFYFIGDRLRQYFDVKESML